MPIKVPVDIALNIQTLKSSVPSNITIVAVSKTMTVPVIMEAYGAGQRIFGENRVQELVSKQPLLPPGIEWHFIGHLQTNKVKYIAPFISLIHSIDRLSLLNEVNREALRNQRVIDCLLQFHIATEETKYGLSLQEAKAILGSPQYPEMKNIRITGVMGMGSFSDDTALVRSEFRMLHDIFFALKADYFRNIDSFRDISMGMSGDFPVAVEEGSTMIRIGTALFGNR